MRHTVSDLRGLVLAITGGVAAGVVLFEIATFAWLDNAYFSVISQ